MPGRFEGMSDAEWKLFEDIFPEKARTRKERGMPAAHPRKVLNSLLFILTTGCRWCDLPQGPCWASKSSAHRRLKSWHSDGRLKRGFLGRRRMRVRFAEDRELPTALFLCGKGGGPDAAHGYKGKGVLIHLFADAEGMPLSACSAPANKDERKHAGKLIEKVAVKTGKGKAGRPRKT